MDQDIIQRLTEVLQKTFGFARFRDGQLESMVALMEHGRLLCIQPTGYGKSLLYQLPAMLLDGITVVISPLLALMRDQVEQLNHRFGISAVSFNTDQSHFENAVARRKIQFGNSRLVFIAPEQLESVERFEFLKQLPIRLLVVDEAHCISTWGHDFRPSYRQIIKLTHALVQANPDIKLLALTATANKKTEKDIKDQLTVDDKPIIVQRESMNRTNIRLTVIHAAGHILKLTALTQLLRQLKGSGLIYCATRENTELVAEYLRGQGVKAAAYHAGIGMTQKRVIQQGFIRDDYPIIVATNALGMGVDKPNLRFIIHFEFPGSITAYYQEVGRCGRDGLPADGILLYDAKDSKVQYYFMQAAQPSQDEFQYVLSTMARAGIKLNVSRLKHATGMHSTKLNVIVAELVEQGFLQKSFEEGFQVYQRTQKKGEPSLTRYQTQYQIRQAELISMQQYAEQPKKCLMEILRAALGDRATQPCGQCSQCVKSRFAVTMERDLVSAVATWVDKRSMTAKNKTKPFAAALG